MTFNLTLTPAVLSKLTNALSELATDVTYQPGTPGELTIDKFDPKNEGRIMDVLTETLPPTRDVLPTWGELTRAQRKRQTAL